MGLMELEAKLRADADREIQEIKAKSEAEAEEIVREIRSSAEKEAARIISEGERKAAMTANKIVDDARLEASRNESREKKAVIERVFFAAREKILALPDKQKTELLLKLSADPALEGLEVRVLVDPAYYRLVKGARKLKFVEAGLGDFGVILESSDGLVRVDKRINTLMDCLKVSLTPRLVKKLFGGA